MRAIIRKEIRENMVWALLMLLALSAAMAYAVHADAPSGLSLVGNSMVVISAVSFPIIGLALGLLQALQDRRIGRWGFLTHRPISRTRIFFAKVIAGLLLYTLTSALPLAVTIGWVATPGHLSAPFDWHMILPRLSDVLGGIVWYCTGLLVAAREARWIGSRLMPIVFTLLLAAFAWFPLAFWQALVIFIGGVALILPAAWSNFSVKGIFERQPAIARLLQVLSLGTGCAICVGAGMAIVISAIQWVVPPEAKVAQSYRITVDGRILRDTYMDGKPPVETDLRGQPASALAQWPPMAYVWLDGLPSDHSDWSARRIIEGLQNSDSYVQPLVTDGRDRWFYVTPRRTIEGYDLYGHPVGSIGPSGFRAPSQPAEAFPERLYFNKNDRFGSAYGRQPLTSRTTAYELNLGRRELRVLFKTAAEPILAPPAFLTSDGDKRPAILVIVTRSQIHILDANTTMQLFELPLEHSYSQYGRLRIMQITRAKLMVYYASWQPSSDWVVETDGTGRILRRIELPSRGLRFREPQWSEALQSAALPPLPVFLSRAFGSEPRAVTLIVVGLVSLASAVITLLLSRRYAFSGAATTLWTSFNLFTGIPGILTLLSLRRLPARIRCPNCGRLRVVSRETCEHCVAPFAQPPVEGIEVFEMV